MNRDNAEKTIKAIFQNYQNKRTEQLKLNSLTKGKIYELFILSILLKNLTDRGFTVRLSAKGKIVFKSSPGMIKSSDPYFIVLSPNNDKMWLFVDIEFRTFGSQHSTTIDNSAFHEIDLVLLHTWNNQNGYPTYNDIALGVECKSTPNFKKQIVKEVLGIRRELSLLSQPQNSILTSMGSLVHIDVPAIPPSEFWLAFLDPKGKNYSESPKAFGITFKNLSP